jgi:hypothetical protein
VHGYVFCGVYMWMARHISCLASFEVQGLSDVYHTFESDGAASWRGIT